MAFNERHVTISEHPVSGRPIAIISDGIIWCPTAMQSAFENCTTVLIAEKVSGVAGPLSIFDGFGGCCPPCGSFTY